MKLKKLLGLVGMALAGALVLAGHAQAGFIIDDFNTDMLYSVTDSAPADGNAVLLNAPPSPSFPAVPRNVVWEFKDPTGVQPGLGPNNASRDIEAFLQSGDNVSAEVCNFCQAGHYVSGAGPSIGTASFIYNGPSVDVLDYDSVMFEYAADLDGADVIFTFDRAGFADVVVSTIPQFPNGLPNTNMSGNITNPANRTSVMVPLPSSLVFAHLESVRIDITTIRTGTDNLDFSIDNAKLTVPEPGTLAMLGLGLVGLGWQRRRRAG